VEKCGKREGLVASEYSTSWSACSACAGDYEDPDRTTPPDADELADEDEGGAGQEMDFLYGGTKQQVTGPQE